MKTYTVTAKRWARGWELHIDGVGVTQSHGLTDAEEMARDYIEMMEDESGMFEVDIKPEVGDGLDAAARNALRAVQEAEQAQKAAATQIREVVGKLKGAGLTGADVAAYLKVSPQRVSQLAPNKQATVPKARQVVSGKNPATPKSKSKANRQVSA